MASRSFAIKSHPLNKQVSTELVLALMKPNPEGDDYFFDDEPKDWSEFCWYKNKVCRGTAKEIKFKEDLLENQLLEDFKDEDLQRKIDFIPDTQAKVELFTLLEEIPELAKYYLTVSESEKNTGFLGNLRNALRAMRIGNMP